MKYFVGIDLGTTNSGRFKSGGTVSRCNVTTNSALSPRPNVKTTIFTVRQKSSGFFLSTSRKFSATFERGDNV